ncbi:LysR family transcriptional regulator [Endozoicomonadaceae bacterium StTr2]
MSSIDRLDIRQLRVFRAVLQERNLSRVASLMGLTQQAVSNHLRKLRDVFEDPLFIRSGHGMIPTPKAEQLGAKLDSVFVELESLLEQSSFEPASLNGVYTICATDYAQSVVLPVLLSEIRKQAPHLKIIVRDFEIDDLDHLMSSGAIDLTLTFPEFIPAHYPYQVLFEEHHVCVAGKHSQLANEPLSIARIASLPQLIVSPSRANLRGSHDRWFEQRGGKRNIVMSVPFFAAAADCIKNTDMIAFLPSRLLPDERLTRLELDETPPGFEVIAAWHMRSSRDPLHRWILDLLKALHHQPEVEGRATKED